MSDLQLTQILQVVDGEQFEWWLHPLADGRIQAVWREPITGGLSRTRPLRPFEYDHDVKVLGEMAARMRAERIMSIGDTEYHLESYACMVSVCWLDDQTGEERKSMVRTAELSVMGITTEDVLTSILNPQLRIR